MQENTDKIVSDIYNKSFEKYLEVKFHKDVPKKLAKLINDNLPDPSNTHLSVNSYESHQ